MHLAPVNRSPFRAPVSHTTLFSATLHPINLFLHPMTPYTRIPFSHPTESVEIEKKIQMKFAFLIKKSPVEVALEMEKKNA